jgi:hypothetical protein
MLHQGEIGRLQPAQNERGLISEISRGSRYATTPAKLPTQLPIRKARIAPAAGVTV